MDSPDLNRLRQEIDAIDGSLHDLVRQRAGVVAEIGRAKPAGGLGLRPGREAAVLRRRLAAHDGAFPPAALFRMWREMMSAFTLMQTPGLRVAVCRPADQPGYWDLARDHFGCQIPFVARETPAQVLADVRADARTLGVVPAPQDTETTPWWPLLASGEPTLPNVVARLPFLAMPNARSASITAVVLARIEPEVSGEDRSLLVIESSGALSRARIGQALAQAELPAFSLALDRTHGGLHHYLVELAGLVADGDPRLGALQAALGVSDARVASIGGYAVPLDGRS
ncbi:MAG: chorismate mutase [Alphaproteobacteria bacterium]|nr:chorismate mutase [Alphaproteobacteria bacterium]